MNAQDIHTKLKTQFGDAVGDLTDAKVDPFVTVDADWIVEICQFAQAEAGLEFDYCEDVTGIDWPDKEITEKVKVTRTTARTAEGPDAGEAQQVDLVLQRLVWTLCGRASAWDSGLATIRREQER